jgi:hypothetical protein
MPSRVMEHPILTLMAVVSAILIALGRIERAMWWGDWAFFAGIGLIVLAGVLFVVQSRR